MRLRVWDLPTRAFHWLLVAAVAGAFITESTGHMDWHARCGYAVIGLLAFRLVWGFAGGTYARFTQFVPGPRRLLAWLRGHWQGAGHNPLGALSVLAMLGVLLLQAGSGLFSNDDSTFFGPLYPLVSRDTSDLVTNLHRLLSNGVILLVALHIGAIVFHARVRRQNLVRPMFSGWTDEAPAGAAPAQGGSALAFVIAVLVAGAAVWLASGAWLPPPPAPAPTPAW